MICCTKRFTSLYVAFSLFNVDIIRVHGLNRGIRYPETNGGLASFMHT